MNPLKIIGGLLSPISEAYKANQTRKTAKEAAKAKIKMAKQDGDFNLNMSDKEWEALSKEAESGTWKDEYVTIIITLPIPAIMIGAVYQAFTGDATLLVGINEGIGHLKNLGLDMGELMYIVVLAAVGIKGVKSFL